MVLLPGKIFASILLAYCTKYWPKIRRQVSPCTGVNLDANEHNYQARTTILSSLVTRKNICIKTVGLRTVLCTGLRFEGRFLLAQE